jgi:hypothetical protein
MQYTAPTSPEHTIATSRSKPGRWIAPDPERPRSSSITVTDAKPAASAAFARSYCRRWLSRLPVTWAMVDWRTYTTAARPIWSGVILGLIHASQLCFGNQSLQQEIGQGLHQPLWTSLRSCLSILSFQLENKLRSIVAPVSPHSPPPSFSKDWIVRLASDSRRATREHWQAR